MDKKPEPTTRAALLDAAGRLVRQHGASALTLDAVAREAGVSKGGLLYHFPSKEALITAMIKALGTRMLSEVAAIAARQQIDKAPLTHAIITHTERSIGHADKLPVALIAALAGQPDLLEPARQMVRDRFSSLREEGVAFEIAAIANLAADGLWFMELLDIEPFTAAERTRLFQALRELVDGA